jgi:hypothetical protein
VPELVKSQVFPDAGARLDVLEGSVTQIRGVEEGADFVREGEVLILPEPS